MDTKPLEWFSQAYMEEKEKAWNEDHVDHNLPGRIVAYEEDGRPTLIVDVTGDREVLERALVAVAKVATHAIAFIHDAYTVTDPKNWEEGTSVHEAFIDPTHPAHGLVTECVNVWAMDRNGAAAVSTHPYWASATSFRWEEGGFTSECDDEGASLGGLLPDLIRPALEQPRMSDIMDGEDPEVVNLGAQMAMGMLLQKTGLPCIVMLPQDKVEPVMEQMKARGLV